jgi:CubicO group peptidase (beta-lactamase class C family)
MRKAARKRGWKKGIVIIISVFLILALGYGIFAIIASYRMSLLPAMSFEEMLGYTTKNRKDALITVGIVDKDGASFTVYGENATVLPSHEYKYEIGSITKTFTTSLLCKAIYDGKAKLSDSIARYIELPSKEYYPSFQRLVTHTSGYRSYYFDWQSVVNFFNGGKNYFYGINTGTLHKQIGRISLEDKDYPFAYSNFGISVVGSALAGVYGRDFTTLMNDFIKSDLKLENTVISDGTGDLQGYWRWKPDDGYIPAGALISTISDMMKYLQLHMREELPYLSMSHEPLARVSTAKRYEELGIRIDATGIGWMIDAKNNLIWHNGGTSKFNSYLAFDKEKQLGVIILSNLPPGYRIPATIMGAKLITELQNKGDEGMERQEDIFRGGEKE